MPNEKNIQVKGIKCRAYPNYAQQALLAKTFGCNRVVWNKALEIKQKAYKNRGKTISIITIMRAVTIWKHSYMPWLADVDSISLQQTLRDLDKAYKSFFRRGHGYPKYKAKTEQQSYRTNNPKVIDENHIYLPKVGSVRCRITQDITGRTLNATVSKMTTGKYFITLQTEFEPERLEPVDKTIGIDLGVKDAVICSDGVVFENQHITKKYEKKLARAQRKLSKTKGSRKGEKASSRHKKVRRNVARIHEKIANSRRDFTQKLTSQLIRENQVIAAEDLNVSGMLKNHYLAKSVADVSMAEIVRELKYKSEWYSRTFVQVDRFYPSSQLCSVCGYRNPATKSLSVRAWTCPRCGTHHDRDINAARNIEQEGLRILGWGTPEEKSCLDNPNSSVSSRTRLHVA